MRSQSFQVVIALLVASGLSIAASESQEQAPGAATAATLSVSPNPSTATQTVTLVARSPWRRQAQCSNRDGGFFDLETSLGTATLSTVNSVQTASLELTSLGAGPHTISARVFGDTHCAASRSSSVAALRHRSLPETRGHRETPFFDFNQVRRQDRTARRVHGQRRNGRLRADAQSAISGASPTGRIRRASTTPVRPWALERPERQSRIFLRRDIARSALARRNAQRRRDLNANGQVVGWSYSLGNGAQRGFLFSAGVTTDLNDLIPAGSGWTLTHAVAINDSGQIVGYRHPQQPIQGLPLHTVRRWGDDRRHRLARRDAYRAGGHQRERSILSGGPTLRGMVSSMRSSIPPAP